MQRRLQDLDDGAAAMLEAYAKLLKSAQVHGETEQQVGEFQSSVLVAGLVWRPAIARTASSHTHTTPRIPRHVSALVLTGPCDGQLAVYQRRAEAYSGS